LLLGRLDRCLLRTHAHFDGITLAPDGKQLGLDYHDDPDDLPSPGEPFFRYVISLHSSPKLITGRSPSGAGAERELAYSDIPQDVIDDACRWIESNVAATSGGQGKLDSQILTDYLSLLERHRVIVP
jgi:hypothetical protein